MIRQYAKLFEYIQIPCTTVQYFPFQHIKNKSQENTPAD